MTPEDPIELDAAAAVQADDALVERLRSALSPEDAVVWDDDEDVDDDLSYALLRALQRDVSMVAEAPAARVVPLSPRSRRLGRTATVATVAAALVSVAGVAAAATSSPGDPLYGVRSAVASAVHDAVDAVTPTKPIGPSAAHPAAATPTATISPRGAQVSTAARSAGAVVQIEERIATATRLLDAGRPRPAGEVLDQAQRRLPLVSDVARRADFQQQIDALRARAAAMSAPHGKPSPGQQPTGQDKVTHRPTPRRTAASHRDDTPGQSGQTGGSKEPRTKPLLPRRVLPAPAASAQAR